MKLLFLGNFYPETIKSNVLECVRGYYDGAADTFQKALIKGFIRYYDKDELFFFTTLAIGTYPLKYKKCIIPKTTLLVEDTFLGEIPFFINLPIIDRILKFINLKRLLKKKIEEDEEICVVIYSLYSLFLFLIRNIKKNKNNIHVILIVPDLPEFMSSNKNVIYLLLKRFDRYVINICLKCVDGFVLINSNMSAKLNLKNKPWITIEGIYNLENEIKATSFEKRKGTKIIFYSGGISKLYGLDVLLRAFHLLKKTDVELWLCGSGDYVDELEKNQKLNNNIRYLGVLSHSEVLDLQLKVDILINPRVPNGEFTKYSFPSKTIEYLASGNPVIMFDLLGIPEEYKQYLYIVKEASSPALAEKILEVLSLPNDIRQENGQKAKRFILDKKNSFYQVGKIINLIRNNYVYV